MVDNEGALGNLRVLDLTRVVAGPLCGQMLGDLGAEVIKVERPDTGDELRRVGPPFIPDENGDPTSESTYFHVANRNKRAICINFADPRGADLIRRLAADSDILIENYRPGTLAAYGLGYADLAAINPRLIYCSITGFGQSGPYSGNSGYDYVVQGMGGVMSVTGQPGGQPTRIGIPIADIAAGMNASIGILAAVNYRTRTGKGQHVDIALYDTQLAMMLNVFSGWFNGGKMLGISGNDHPSAAPHGVYPAENGHIIIATFSDGEFARVADALGHPEWKADLRFRTNRDRVANREALNELMSAILRTRSKAAWIELLSAAKVPVGPINSMADVEADRQVNERGMIVDMPPRADGVHIRTIGNPVKLSVSPARYDRSAPAFGEHTDEELGQVLGIDAATLAELHAAKVL